MQIDLGAVGLALGAGIVAFFNPCGFALLPSYVAHYLGSRASAPATWWERGLHGLALGGAVSAGFFTVFLALGIAVSLVGTALGAYFPWAAMLLGLGLIALGVLTFLGREVSLPLTPISLDLTPQSPFPEREGGAPLPVSGRGWGRGRGMRGYFFYYFYGIGYAVASCGCTLPIFMIYVVGPTFTVGPLNGLLNFGAYASGMTLMMLLLSVSIAYSKGSLDRSLPLRQAVIGASIPVVIVLVLMWSQPQLSTSWGVAFSGTNRIFLSLFALALPALLFFQIRHWERATQWLNGLLLIAAGGYLIYYQIFEYGVLR
jgi:cytochrome c-type biogenesis protein